MTSEINPQNRVFAMTVFILSYFAFSIARSQTTAR